MIAEEMSAAEEMRAAEIVAARRAVIQDRGARAPGT